MTTINDTDALMLEIDGIKIPVSTLSDDVKGLLAIYQNWETRRKDAVDALTKAQASLQTLQQEVFLFEAAIKSLSSEVMARINKDVLLAEAAVVAATA